ncbi:hypothetical protein ASPZODRAFT_1573300 [Penicilliopsis zonata CBS 506.65]|uniref:SRR1-like domain-containing protein n=1 Tax=Penicilliopsis zonata CBS 506.65 TaxID=1073090 RepID=A0A1L9SMC2_9EURO|nr:hypothetical protein ASPZODRAFT_1573300 [Penicilliopsis zonata CBS 506.65]OJJ48360.1 hypothetical protein ASPZODRAFT_1573300 [Penicilliopsis zonata CBS 506.65]
MPHSSRKKKPIPQKRLQVTDDHGWTHVTTTRHARRAVHQNNANANANNTNNTDANTDNGNEAEIKLPPAEPPRGLTLTELTEQFAFHRARWESSATYAAVRRELENHQHHTAPADITSIICIGLGSPSGFLRGGWVDRRSVSMYQLAALATVSDFFEVNVCAQDPVFNTLDKQLLETLSIRAVDHPAAFELVNESSLLFCPGAEKSHLERLLPRSPALVFGGPLESTDSIVLDTFLQGVGSLKLPVFEELEHAFWNMRLYWRINE